MKFIAIDIDGVLNDYPRCWVKYANSVLDTNFEDLFELKSNVPYRRYNDVKSQYRKSGHEETLPIKENAEILLDMLKDRDYFIIIMTARPINKYNESLVQTVNWLRKNKLQYDFLYFSDRKHLDIIEKFKNLEFMIEDNRAFANDVSAQGYRVFLVNNEYNYGKTNDGVIRVNSLLEILDYLEKEDL